MRRHLPRLLLTGALMSPVTLYALGLGEIRLNSALNQPFDAEIELISPTPDELAGLKVGLAGNDLFSRYGLDRPAFLSSFDFSVSRSRDGRATIKVRSNRSITEPFVTLLVEASWARGRLLREYTVLLDPPVFMPSQPETPAPVASAQSGARTEGRIERPAPQPETPAAERPAPLPTPEEPVEPAAAAAPAQVGGEYTVERNDTLYRIASRVNPGSPSMVNRTMIALFRANPAAFDGNINRLRAGSVLRIPDTAEIETIAAGEANAEVARQTAEWAGAAPADEVDESSRLRLVTPEETPAAPTAQAPATPEQQPAVERPATAAAPGSGQEDRRLEVASPELAAAQQNVDETPAEPAPAQTEPVDESTAEAAGTPAPAAEQPAPAPAARPTPRPETPAAPEPTLAERISDFWWILVALGLLVVIGLMAVFVKRRRESDAGSLDVFPAMDFEPHQPRSAPAPARMRDRADSFHVDDDATAAVTSFDDLGPEPETARRPEPVVAREPVAAAAPANSVEDTLSSETSVRLDQQDALAEADFHMAYGLYDQAADLVKIAIEREPERRDLKLKLLEIYFVWGNRDLFLETARELHSTRSAAPAGEWDKVLIMGKQIASDDPMFQGEASGGLDLVDVNLEGGENRVDVDLFAEPEGEQPAGLDLEFASGERKAPRADAAASNPDLDFLLDEPERGAEDDPTRELDPLARTQETPTIESPMLDRSSTLRAKADGAFARGAAEQTAELSIDDLGLDVNALDTEALEDTSSLESDTDDVEMTHTRAHTLRDDEMTQLAPSLGSLDRTMEAPRPQRFETAKTSDTGRFDVETTGTIFLDQVDLSGGDTIEQPRPDVDATASMRAPRALDVDLDRLGGPDARDMQRTVRQQRAGDEEIEQFSNDVFADRTAESPRIDLDVGEALAADDHEPTNRQITTEMELSELEPVTMSEVGTKLDLARAYMDMGDPDGARSILEEVLSEGTPNQKQEAQRLMESIR